MPTGSLGRHLRTAPERFPRDRVLLTPDPARTAEMKRRLDAIAPGPKIGLSWRSRSNGRLRSQFYASVADLEPIVRIPGVTFVNLQYDDCAVELLEIRERFGVTVHAFDDLDLFDDLDGAAALTAALDFVVSANTSVATIAGGVGVPAVEFCGRPIADALSDRRAGSVVPVDRAGRQADRSSLGADDAADRRHRRQSASGRTDVDARYWAPAVPERRAPRYCCRRVARSP